jgi:hypothetical protein
MVTDQILRSRFEDPLTLALADCLHQRGYSYRAIFDGLAAWDTDLESGQDILWDRQIGPFVDKVERLLGLAAE